MDKAIGYVRVSTDHQATNGVSLENQREQLKRYCEYRGFDLVETIEDPGISGGINKARPGFMTLLDRIESGDVGAVVLYSLERLSRDMLTLLALERLLDEYDIELHTIEGQVDTSTPEGFVSFSMRAFLGEVERRQVKFRTKKAMEYKKKNGEVVGAIPYGYRRDGDRLIRDETEQEVVTLINSLYELGLTLTEISRELAGRGIGTRTGRDFTLSQVKRIVKDYRGVYETGQTRLSKEIRSFVEAIG